MTSSAPVTTLIVAQLCILRLLTGGKNRIEYLVPRMRTKKHFGSVCFLLDVYYYFFFFRHLELGKEQGKLSRLVWTKQRDILIALRFVNTYILVTLVGENKILQMFGEKKMNRGNNRNATL